MGGRARAGDKCSRKDPEGHVGDTAGDGDGGGCEPGTDPSALLGGLGRLG